MFVKWVNAFRQQPTNKKKVTLSSSFCRCGTVSALLRLHPFDGQNRLVDYSATSSLPRWYSGSSVVQPHPSCSSLSADVRELHALHVCLHVWSLCVLLWIVNCLLALMLFRMQHWYAGVSFAVSGPYHRACRIREQGFTILTTATGTMPLLFSILHCHGIFHVHVLLAVHRSVSFFHHHLNDLNYPTCTDIVWTNWDCV